MTKSAQENTQSIQFLIEEYKILNDRFKDVRDTANSRLNFLITLASATIGVAAILAATDSVSDAGVKGALIIALMVLSLVGFNTHKFTISRDIESDRIEKGMARIRHYFIEMDSKLANYLVYSSNDDPTNYVLKYKRSALRRTARILHACSVGLGFGFIYDIIGHKIAVSVIAASTAYILDYLFLYHLTKQELTDAKNMSSKYVKFSAKTQQVLMEESKPQG